MFSSFKKSACNRKAGIAKTATILCGLYIAKNHISDRLEEVKTRLEQDRAARDRCVVLESLDKILKKMPSLHRRFQQTQDDVSYTVMALLSTLGDQIHESMDVEVITGELQARNKAKNARRQNQPGQPSHVSSSLASSFDVVQEHEVCSRDESVSVASTSFSLGGVNSGMVESNVGHQGKVQTSYNVQTQTIYDSTTSKDNVSLHSSRVMHLSWGSG